MKCWCLSVPQKKVHPEFLEATLQIMVLDKLNELQPKETKETKKIIDPRWERTKKIIKRINKFLMAHPKRKISKPEETREETHYKGRCFLLLLKIQLSGEMHCSQKLIGMR